jgi:hypothetical protein
MAPSNNAAPTIIGDHPGVVGAVEGGEADSSAKRDRRPIHVLMDSGDAPATLDCGSRALAAQVFLAEAEGRVIYLVELRVVRLVVSRDRRPAFGYADRRWR